MSNTNNSNKAVNSKTTTAETDSKNFVSQLQQTINDTDWFLNNISVKWERENPELAKQWQDILKSSEINNSDQPEN